MKFAPSSGISEKVAVFSIQGWPVVSPEAQKCDSRPEAAAKVSLGRITRDWSGGGGEAGSMSAKWFQ